MLAKAVLEIQFHVRKSTASFINTSAYAWLIALCGTIAPLLLRPTDDLPDFSVATVLMLIGLAMQVYIILRHERRPEEAFAGPRMRREGLYRFVRHPLYLAFLFSQYGYVLNHTSPYNVCVLAAVTVFQVLRVNEEERLLLDRDPFRGSDPEARWRIIPWVF